MKNTDSLSRLACVTEEIRHTLCMSVMVYEQTCASKWRLGSLKPRSAIIKPLLNLFYSSSEITHSKVLKAFSCSPSRIAVVSQDIEMSKEAFFFFSSLLKREFFYYYYNF